MNRWRVLWPAIIVLALFVGLLLLAEFGVVESYKIDFPAELFD